MGLSHPSALWEPGHAVSQHRASWDAQLATLTAVHCCAGFALGDGDTTLFITFSQENMAISHNSIAECFLQASSQRLLLKWGFECVIPSLLRKSTQLQPSTYTRLLLTLIATSCLKYLLPICPPSPPTSTQVEILLLRGSQYFMKY